MDPSVDQRPALHLLIYSELLLYAGGRETWLTYFLPLLAASARLRAVTVHHMRPHEPGQAVGAHLSPMPGTPVRFVDGGLELHGPEGAPRRFLTFTRAALADLRQTSRPGDVLLAVGVHGEAPPALLGWLVAAVLRRRLHLVTWVREASLRLVRERRGAVVHAGFRLLRRAVLAASSKIILNGRDTYDVYAARFPRQRRKMVLIPNAVDVTRFTGPLPDPAGDGELRVGYVARFLAAKGFLDLLAVARLLAEEHPGARISFHAWGQRDPLEPVGAPPPNTTLHPALPNPEVPGALRGVHVFLSLNHTRRLEIGGLNHSLLEALAAGRAVLAWDNPCHTQVLDERNAFLVPEGDVPALARRLLELSLDPSGLVARAAAGRRTAGEYSCERHVERFLHDVLDPLLRRA